MVKSDAVRPTIAEICRARGLTLRDLSRMSGVPLASIKQLEQNPPRKPNTWHNTWKERIRSWMPLLGPTFLEVLESQALSTCPKDIVEELRIDFYKGYSTFAGQGSESQNALDDRREVAQREREHLRRAELLDAKGYWHAAEIQVARAALLFPQHVPQWAYHRLTIAQLRVNQGELASAESLVHETVARHQAALSLVGGEWEPSNRALAEATLAWSLFLKGELEEPLERFRRTVGLARQSNDTALLHRGLHMGARTLAERDVMRAYFIRSTTDRRLKSEIAAQSLQGIGGALKLDLEGSPTQAFGLWYTGVLLGLSGDVAAGRHLLSRAEVQLRANHMITSAQSHTALSRVHFDILSANGDTTELREFEAELREIINDLMFEKYPYAMADALITLAACRAQRKALFRIPSERCETADLLCLALIVHPYPKHFLWEMGKHLLTQIVMPEFPDGERTAYERTLGERIRSGEKFFSYLLHWHIDLSPIKTLISLLVPA